MENEIEPIENQQQQFIVVYCPAGLKFKSSGFLEIYYQEYERGRIEVSGTTDFYKCTKWEISQKELVEDYCNKFLDVGTKILIMSGKVESWVEVNRVTKGKVD